MPLSAQLLFHPLLPFRRTTGVNVMKQEFTAAGLAARYRNALMGPGFSGTAIIFVAYIKVPDIEHERSAFVNKPEVRGPGAAYQ